jgi:CubicO group peptidase (beta-lactamase class C family)
MRLALAWSAILLCVPAAAQSPELEAYIAGYAEAHDFNGTILVEKQGRISYEKSFGKGNFEFQVPATPRTRYRIASITKAFTAVLILQLQEAGKLDLQQTIGHYLPDYRGEAASRVTLHQLLNHTSGIENFDQVKSLEQALTGGLPTYQFPYTVDQLLQKFCSGKLVHVPGEVFDYNNADYLILGKIIEKMQGKPFARVLGEAILAPLGMADTGMLQQRDIVAGLADSYFYREDSKAFSPDLPAYPENWYASGSMYSTARDLLKFSNALFAGRLISARSLALMTRPGLDDYGYGVWSYDRKIGDRKYHVIKRPGRIMGTQTQLYRLADQDITVILLSNASRADTDELVAEIGKRMLR